MKRHGNLFEKAFTTDSLYRAYVSARKNKRSKRACFQFERGFGKNIDNLYNELHNNQYKPRPYYKFTIHEPKQRIIFAPAFRDCVVQHAIYTCIYPIFDKTFIDHSYACRNGKGTHRAADYAQKALRKTNTETYTLKLDIKRFFYQIDRKILKNLLNKKIKDKKLLSVMMSFAEYDEPIGIPIGNILSQLYALIYLNPLDHFIKRVLKAKWYVRYVDDFVIFGLTLEEAKSYKNKIESYINKTLNLQLSRFSIAKSTRGINFVGYRIWRSKKFVRKMALIKTRKNILLNRRNSVISHISHAKKTRSLQYIFNKTKELNDALYHSLPPSIKRLHDSHPAHSRKRGSGGRSRYRIAD